MPDFDLRFLRTSVVEKNIGRLDRKLPASGMASRASAQDAAEDFGDLRDHADAAHSGEFGNGTGLRRCLTGLYIDLYFTDLMNGATGDTAPSDVISSGSERKRFRLPECDRSMILIWKPSGFGGRRSQEGGVMNYLRCRFALILIAGLVTAAAPALAAPLSFTVHLTGAHQVPAVKTKGKGTADLTYNKATRAVTWSIKYSGLASAVTMAHFHHAPAGKNGPVAIWLTKKGAPVSSPIKGHATLTPAQAKQFMAGDWYINIHTKNHPAGALRGQVVPPKS